MKIFITLLIIILSGITYSIYLYTEQEFGFHIHHISEKNIVKGKISSMWLQSCPEIESAEVEPNSIIGIVVAGREMLDDKFDFVLTTLVECGYDINERGSIGLTPLQAAILYSDLIAIKKLVSLGANSKLLLSGEAAGKWGEINSLEYAGKLKSSDPEIIEYLMNLP